MDNLIKFAIKQPIAVAAMVFLIIAFGFVSLQKIPIQMTPDIDKPVLQVRVSWPGASPKDVEREVVTRVELAVSSLTGVETVESDSRFGSARVTLTYSVGQDMDIALVQLLSKVSSIDGLPFDAKRPTVRTSNSDDSPISRLAMIKLPGSKVQDLGSLGDFVEYEIIEKLSRIEGVSEITFRGGQKKELKVALDINKLAEYSISIPAVLNALRASSAQVTAGEIIEGKRTYSLRAEAISYTPKTARNIILRSETGLDGIPVNVKLEDVAKIYMSYKKPTSFRRLNGQDAITFAVIREPDSNVVEIIKNLKIEIEKLNNGILAENGLVLNNVYDETVYINAAIKLVQQNIIIGGILIGRTAIIPFAGKSGNADFAFNFDKAFSRGSHAALTIQFLVGFRLAMLQLSMGDWFTFESSMSVSIVAKLALWVLLFAWTIIGKKMKLNEYF